MRSFITVETRTFSGLYIGHLPAFKFNPTRMRLVATRYLKGLHRYVFGYRIPDNAMIKMIINPEAVWANKSEIQAIFSKGKTEIIQKDIFSYTYIKPIDNPQASFWLLIENASKPQALAWG